MPLILYATEDDTIRANVVSSEGIPVAAEEQPIVVATDAIAKVAAEAEVASPVKCIAEDSEAVATTMTNKRASPTQQPEEQPDAKKVVLDDAAATPEDDNGTTTSPSICEDIADNPETTETITSNAATTTSEQAVLDEVDFPDDEYVAVAPPSVDEGEAAAITQP
jgi:hypothetical protein